MISHLTNQFAASHSDGRFHHTMTYLMLKDLPRYECLLGMARLHPELDPSACEAYLNLLRAGDEAYRKSEAYMNEHGMTPGRFTIMMLFYDKMTGGTIPRTPAELADMGGVTRATITGLIDPLERDGFVNREHDAGDRRMMQIHMTPKGLNALRGILPGHFKQMAAQMSALNEGERKTLVRLLNKIAASSPASHIEAKTTSAVPA
ncbi:MAG TPA: MarR family transcriptional regulator [Solirubrobacteraceae bacterium]